jgi:hypothetical protein
MSKERGTPNAGWNRRAARRLSVSAGRAYPQGRRGGIYVAVLGTAALVTVIGLASMATWRVQAASANAAVDAAEARMYSEAAVDHAVNYLSTDPSWRTNRAQGTWWSGVNFGKGTFTIAGADPVDGDFTNRPYDPLVLTCTGYRRSAAHITTVTLNAQGVPLPALANAFTTVGQLRVTSGQVLTATGAPVYTNGQLRLDGGVNIAGAASCSTFTGTGTASGGVTLLAPALAMPGSAVVTMYKNLGTAISPPGTINNAVLAPGFNSIGGGTNSDGVYVITTSSDIIIQKLRLCGTLVVMNAGHKLTISGPVLMQPARPDYPVLIVQGQLFLQYDSTTTLSEASAGYNFNPAGAPYQGVTDSDTSDTYPCEIDGLVHCQDQAQMGSNMLIRGAFICESNASTAVQINSATTIVYDPTLFTSPPMGYTTAVNMKAAPGGWKQTVLP